MVAVHIVRYVFLGAEEQYSRIILISILAVDVVVVVHSLSILLGVMLGLLTVDEVHALGLGELVDFSTRKTDEELLGELVRDGLSWMYVLDIELYPLAI